MVEFNADCKTVVDKPSAESSNLTADILSKHAFKIFDPEILTKLLEEDDNKGGTPNGTADLELAYRHQQARVVRDLESLKSPDAHGIERCACCNYPVNAPTFNLCVNTDLLKQLGPGFPLYYRFLVYIWSMTALTLAIAGIACLIYNISSDHSDDWDAESDSFTIKCSLGNNGDPDQRDDVFPLWQFILHLVSMIVILVTYHLYWSRKQHSLQQDIDKDITTPSDYTIYIENLGKAFAAAEVKEFFEQHGRPDGQSAVVEKVNIVYDISEYVELSRELQALRNRQAFIERYRHDHGGQDAPPDKCCCFPMTSQTLAQVNDRIKELQLKLERLEVELKPGEGRDLQKGQAFVTFKTQEDARLVRYKWEGEWQSNFWNFVFRCFKSSSDFPSFKGRSIRVRRAPEPNDIYWENLSCGFKKQFSNTLATMLVTLAYLTASFGMLYGTSYYQTRVYNDYRDDDPSQLDLVKIRVLSIAPSFGVVIINMALGQVIRRTSSFEKHHTLTEYHTSVAIKLTVAQCLNTALIALIVNYDPQDNWFVPGGLATDMTYILLSNAILQPISYILSPMYLVRLYKRRKVKLEPYVTQAEANLVFEGPPVDMANRYSFVMKTFIVTLAFAAIIPLGIPISMCGLVFAYWVDKTLLLKRHCRPNRLSGRLQEVMSKFVPWAVLVHAVLTYLWMNALNPDQSAIAFIWMWVVLGYVFLPIDTLVKCRKVDFSKIAAEGVEKQYQEAALNFVDDYDRENPVTSEEGWAWYFQLIEKSKDVKAGEFARFKAGMLQKMGAVSSNVHAYAISKASLPVYNGRLGGHIYQSALIPSFHQKIKSVVIMNPRQSDLINSYNAPAVLTPFSPALINPFAKQILGKASISVEENPQVKREDSHGEMAERADKVLFSEVSPRHRGL
jgi:hypothetical protein